MTALRGGSGFWLCSRKIREAASRQPCAVGATGHGGETQPDQLAASPLFVCACFGAHVAGCLGGTDGCQESRTMKPTLARYSGIQQSEGDSDDSPIHSLHSPPSSSADVDVSNQVPLPNHATSSQAAARLSLSSQRRMSPLAALLVICIVVALLVAIVFELSISNSLLEDSCLEDARFASQFQTRSLSSLDNDESLGSAPFQFFTSASNPQQLYMLINSTVILHAVPFLYVEQLVRGMGDRKSFLDAGAILCQDLVRFRLQDDHLLLELQQNRFRSRSDLTTQSFAGAIVWRTPVLQTTEAGYWINASELGLQTAGFVHPTDLPSVIANAYGMQYQYVLNRDLSFVDTSRCKANSMRICWTSNLTYQLLTPASPPHLQDILATSKFLSIAVRRTFLLVENPGQDGRATLAGTTGYHPRLFHPRSGFNYISYMDEDSSIFASRSQQYIVRHRLWGDQGELLPIRYYVDRRIPSDIRTALVEGVNWWDEAFQAAGYPPHTFQAELAPADFDPYDFYFPQRIHYVQWIDRDLRSYSVGQRIVHPWTGEILKGHVRVEGLRLRQDAMLLSALLSPYTLENGSIPDALQRNMTAALMQRIRHLGAHEVGHSLGLSHNFAGSARTTIGQWASVMDYPPPLVGLVDINASLNTSHSSKLALRIDATAYSSGIGAFDKVSIAYGYQTRNRSSACSFSSRLEEAEDERDFLWSLLAQARQTVGYDFLTDLNSGRGGADWRASLWDIGLSPELALNASMKVRQVAMQGFSKHVLSRGSCTSRLGELFPLVYLWHRYELETTCKLVGGQSIEYIVRGEGEAQQHDERSRIVPAHIQRQAIEQLLLALQPAALEVPASLRGVSLAPCFGYEPEVGGWEDTFATRTGGVTLDEVVLLESLAYFIFSTLLEPTRMERIYQQHQQNASLPSLAELLGKLIEPLFLLRPAPKQLSWSQQHLQYVFLHAVFELLASSSSSSALVRYELSLAVGRVNGLVAGDMHEMGCENVLSAGLEDAERQICWQYQQVQTYLAARKPFLSVHPLPEGPPI